jgi:ADP-heptose:LPS heptosyltransferase
MINTQSETCFGQHMQNGGKVQSLDRPKVLIVRLSAIGDSIIAARTVVTLLKAGFDPVFCTQAPCDEVARCIPGLRSILLLGRDGSLSLSVRAEGIAAQWEQSANLGALQLDSGRPLPLLDLQRTARSRRFILTLRRAIPALRFNAVSVEKRSLERILQIVRARLALRQRPSEMLVDSVFSVPKSLVRVHDLQHKLVDESRRPQLVPPAPAPWLSVAPIVAHNGLRELPLDEPYVVLFPGASGPLKMWGVERFSELISFLQKQTTVRFVVIGGQEEVQAAEELAQAHPSSVLNLAGRLKVGETLAVIAAARYVVTGDSFPAHAADALGVPASVLFGATTPWFGFAPLSPAVRVHYLNLSCSPCTRHGKGRCRFGNLRCMGGISAASVAVEVLKEIQSISG